MEFRRRVVITGAGLITPLGTTTASAWRRLVRGDCGVVDLSESHPELAPLPSTIGARVDPAEFDAAAVALRSQSPRAVAPFIAFALAAAEEALRDAGWDPMARGDRAAQERTGVAIGSGIGSIGDICDAAHVLAGERGHRRLSPNFVPRILANSAAGHVSIVHGFYGPNHSVSTACATGAHAIGDAYRMVERGDADVMVAGGRRRRSTRCRTRASRASARCAQIVTTIPPSRRAPLTRRGPASSWAKVQASSSLRLWSMPWRGASHRSRFTASSAGTACRGTRTT